MVLVLSTAPHPAPHPHPRPGLDYTVAHLGSKTEEPKLDATLCFVRDKVGNSGGVENSAEDAAAASAEASEADAESTAVLRETWDSGEVGGGPCVFTHFRRCSRTNQPTCHHKYRGPSGSH